ncbi:MAG: NAD-dependent epimerase/dehydratase family protein [Thermoproteota archaeon]|nr:NAD-dependent epimerase/dehydratase family protein [Candidatus Brockarchaeota archaeon]
MKVLVIGGTGHIGSYLVPRLVLRGYEVQVLARNPRPRYGGADTEALWSRVEWIVADRIMEEKNGLWGKRMAAVDADVVIDLICYTPEQNRMIVESLEGRVSHFIHCGTIWAYGPSTRVPYREDYPRKPVTEYGILKARIEADLLEKYIRNGFPATVVHPGHISGRKWLPIDPQGTRNGVDVYRRLAHGDVVCLPDTGLATLHHVHADDVAQIFELAILNRKTALGESFSAAAPYALTLAYCCEFVASLFGSKPNLRFVPLQKMVEVLSEDAFAIMRDHVIHSPCVSIEKAQRLLGYRPRYTTEEIYRECIEYLLESGQLVV